MGKPNQMEVLAGLAKAGGDVDEFIAPDDAEGGAGGEGKEKEVDEVEVAVKTAVLTLPAAPLMSLRDILEREDDPDAADNTIIVWYFCATNAADGMDFCERAARPLSILRAGKDYIMLPMGYTVLQDLWTWACEALGYKLWQAIWFPLPDHWPMTGHAKQRLHETVVDSLAAIPLPMTAAGERMDMVLVPFSVPKHLKALCEARDIHVFGDGVGHFVRKDALHPPPKGPDDVMLDVMRHPKTGEPMDIHVPRGFTCFNHDQLMVAEKIMRDAGIKIVLKPSWESSGKGIIVGVTHEEIEAMKWNPDKGEIVLEEFLDADKNADGSLLLPVVHFVARSQYGEIVEQLIAGTTTYNGTISPSRVPTPAKDRVKVVTELLADAMDLSGFWGVDFLMVKGEPYLIDLNTGRPNGGHVPKIFAARFAPKRPFKSWKDHEVPAHTSILKIQRALSELGLAFDKKTKRGIVVLHLFPGIIGSYLAVGRNDEDLATVLAAWDENKESTIYADDEE